MIIYDTLAGMIEEGSINIDELFKFLLIRFVGAKLTSRKMYSNPGVDYFSGEAGPKIPSLAVLNGSSRFYLVFFF